MVLTIHPYQSNNAANFAYTKDILSEALFFHKSFLYFASEKLRDMTTIQFPAALDKNILHELYADDVDYATLMFDLFLTEIMPQVTTLKQVAEQQNWPVFSQICHKIKPTFGMVGVTQLEHFFEKLETVQNLEDATTIIDIIHNKLAQVLPAVEVAHTHLKSLQDEN